MEGEAKGACRWHDLGVTEIAHGEHKGDLAACQTVSVVGYRLRGATRHRVVIPVVIPQFRWVGMTTLWRVVV